MRKTKLFWILSGLGLTGLGVYFFRRKLIARLLKLPPVRNRVTVTRGLRVVMPDGVALMTDHYAPRTKGSSPTILIRSPYGRGAEAGSFGWAWHFLGQRFAERGYHVIIQTTRGRFDSEGEFEILVHEAEDGRATLDWIAQQPWFNGVVGMWGPSYLGYVQWAVATAAPPQLKALVPMITFSDNYAITYTEGAFALDLALHGLFLFDGMGRETGRSKAETRWRWQHMKDILEPAFDHLPLLEADKLVVGEEVPSYREGLAHPQPDDPYWDNTNLRLKLAQVTAPAHLMSGWYDLFLGELMADYAALKAAGRSPYLTIGPWYHVDFSDLPELLREALLWFDAHLKGDRRNLREKPVRVFVMGAEEWRELDEWPPAAQETPYYLHTQGVLSTDEPMTHAPPRRYRYDPADPTPNLAGPRLFPPAGPVDNRELEARPDVLCYTTPTLAEDVEIMGSPRVELYVRSSLEHTDFFGRLCDVHPDGRSMNICDGLFRVEPGKGEPQPDGSLRLVWELWPTAHRFRSGHRIRLQVSSGAHPRWNRNLGTGEPIATATRMVAAKQTVYHDADHPSVLVLPLALKKSDSGEGET